MSVPAIAAEPILGRRIVSLADVAEGCVSLLHSSSLSRPFVAVREWLPRFDLADLGTDVKVCVTAGDSYAVTRTSRTSWNRDPEIRVVIIGALTSEPYDDQIDSLMAFVEEVRTVFATAYVDLAETMGCDAVRVQATSIESDPPLSIEALEQLRQFTSVLSITFRVFDTI